MKTHDVDTYPNKRFPPVQHHTFYELGHSPSIEVIDEWDEAYFDHVKVNCEEEVRDC